MPPENPQGAIDLSDLLDTSGGDTDSDFKYLCHLMKQLYRLGEKDRYRWIADKTRLDERQITAIAYYVSVYFTIINNDISGIWGENPHDEKYKDIRLPLVEATESFMSLRVSLHGKEREEIMNILRQYKEKEESLEERKPSLRDRLFGGT